MSPGDVVVFQLFNCPEFVLLWLAAQYLGARRRDLSTLRGIVTMGSPLDREACLRYQELLTPRIFNGYGTTEAFWNTFLRPADLPDHAGSAGRNAAACESHCHGHPVLAPPTSAHVPTDLSTSSR